MCEKTIYATLPLQPPSSSMSWQTYARLTAKLQNYLCFCSIQLLVLTFPDLFCPFHVSMPPHKWVKIGVEQFLDIDAEEERESKQESASTTVSSSSNFITFFCYSILVSLPLDCTNIQSQRAVNAEPSLHLQMNPEEWSIKSRQWTSIFNLSKKLPPPPLLPDLIGPYEWV
ncbi:hypothetical protein L218DRAFT_948712 [Marasmius fiardii PR-910]|nr:hypothetical protein L218DRAFT_948712 [Marasmius fiardii PR-910]